MKRRATQSSSSQHQHVHRDRETERRWRRYIDLSILSLLLLGGIIALSMQSHATFVLIPLGLVQALVVFDSLRTGSAWGYGQFKREKAPILYWFVTGMQTLVLIVILFVGILLFTT